MKRWLCLILLLALLLMAGCAEAPVDETAETSATVSETVFSVPQDLPGVWVSASEGQLMLTETITFYENGDLTVSGTYQGTDSGTIYGTYTVSDNQIFCDITAGTTPFKVTYTFCIDGRELILTDADGDAHYLRTS